MRTCLFPPPALVPWARALFATATLALAASAGAHVPATPAAELEAALQAYERNHWLEAYATLSTLADRGHPEASRLALLMWRHGPALYGQRFEAHATQRAGWLLHADCGAPCRPDPVAATGR